MPPFIGKRLGAQAPSIEVVFTVVVGAILQPLDAKLTAEGMESEASIYLNAVESSGPNELSSALRAAVNNLMNSPNIELMYQNFISAKPS